MVGVSVLLAIDPFYLRQAAMERRGATISMTHAMALERG